MTHWIIAGTAALALAGAAQAAQPKAAKATGVRLSATLSGANEVTNTGQTGVGDADGTGTFTGRLNAGQGRLCYTLTVANLDTPAQMAHIHIGVAGKNGGIFLPLSHENLGTEQCITTLTRAQANALLTNPRGYYVNVHTANKPAGAVRGQLAKN